MKLYVVDAFSDQPYTGNPAGVCLLEHPLEDDHLQHIAAEINLSETAFIYQNQGVNHLRWFTPLTEVDLCGHATLASAAILWSERICSIEQPIYFLTRSGQLKVYQTPPYIHLEFPLLPASTADLPPPLREALGVNPHDIRFTGKNHYDWLIELRNASLIYQLNPDFDRIRHVHPHGIMVTALDTSGQYDFISRYFDPGEGINEDPVTGFAHCCLGPYWQTILHKTTMIAYQASRRGGILYLTLHPDYIDIAGQARIFMEARILDS